MRRGECRDSEPSTPKSQLPTPKGSRAEQRGGRRTNELVAASSTPLFDRLSLGVGSWELTRPSDSVRFTQMYDAGAMSLMSRRAMLQALTVNALATSLANAQTRVVSKAKAAGQGRRHARLDCLSRADAQRDIDRDEAESQTAAASDLGAHQGHRLQFAGDRGSAAGVPASAGQGGDRRMPGTRRRGRANWRFRYPTNFEDRYGYNDGPRASPVIDGRGGLHDGRAGAAALPRPRRPGS